MIDAVESTLSITLADAENAIALLVLAREDIGQVTGADTTAARRQLGRLLLVWQARSVR